MSSEFRGWRRFLSGPTRAEIAAFAVTLAATALLAFSIWVAIPFIWDGVEALAIWLDWKLVVLALVLIFYAYSCIDLWQRFTTNVGKPYPVGWVGAKYPLWRRVINGFTAGMVLSIDHALSKFQMSARPILGAAWTKFLSNFHPTFQKILGRSTGIFALIWLSTYAILLFANLWPQEQDACAWKFPKILSCLLTQYESLAAGLIGAGGAIFAGWLAWSAVQIQITGNSDEIPDAKPTPRAPMTEEEARAEGRRLAEISLGLRRADGTLIDNPPDDPRD